MDYMLPDEVYDVLKWIAIVLLPTIGWAVGELAPDFGIDPLVYVHVIDVIGTVIGALIGASQVKAMISAKHED
jgi:uncharacterized membrane-anchored protein